MAALLLVVSYGLLLAAPRSARIAVLREDGPAEYLGALCFFLAAAFFFLMFRWYLRRRASGASALKPYVALAIAVVMFLAAGEEISWGQRILGIATPDAFVEANKQEEINLHNLWISSFDEYRLFTLGWYPYLIGLPLLVAASRRARRLVSRFLPVLPMAVWPFSLLYLVNDVASWVAGKSLIVDGRYDAMLDFPRVELRESMFALLTAIIAYLWWRTAKSADGADGSASRQSATGVDPAGA